MITTEQPLGIVQMGLGGVGRALIGHVLEAQGRYPWLQYWGLGDRSGLIWRPTGWKAPLLRALLTAKESGASLAEFWASEGGGAGTFLPGSLDRSGDAVQPFALPAAGGGLVLVDVTAERDSYPAILAARQAGAHIVLCNKWALAEPQERYDRLLTAGPGQLRYETTVGAALPVLGTLDSLLQAGDTVEEIQAAISGTLGYLTTEIERGVPFSAALRDAQARGYTEPDPRDDLGGTDARRKALILARKLGARLNMADVQVESLVPPELEQVPLPAFWAGLPAVDAEYAGRVEEAAATGKVLRFLAVVTPAGARVGLQAVPRGSLAGTLTGTESLFVFRTARYGDQPLAIRGRGAGASLTAGGVLSDILSIQPGRAAGAWRA